MGGGGLRRVANCVSQKPLRHGEIAKLDRFAVNPHAPSGRSSRIRGALPSPLPGEQATAREFGIIGGYDLGRITPLQQHMLIAVTELTPRVRASIVGSGAEWNGK
jgi:hypothetical protein